MQLDAARVGKGVEDPHVAIQNIVNEKRRIAAQKVQGATDAVSQDDLEAERYEQKETDAKNDEAKMGQIAANAKSPAVADAARKMERKESDEMINDMQKAQAERRKAMAAKIRQREALMKQGDSEKRMQEVVSGIQDEMDVARANAKDVMNFEGTRFEEATRSEKEAEVGGAQNDLAIASDQRAYDTTASLEEAMRLTRHIDENKAKVPIFRATITEQHALASSAVEAQHVEAKNVKEAIELGLDKVIAAQVPKDSKRVEGLKGKIEVVKMEETTETQRLEANDVAYKEMKRDLASAQAKRVSNEKEQLNLKKMIETVKRSPIPGTERGVTVPGELEQAKNAQMTKKMAKLKEDNTFIKEEESNLGMKLEQLKSEGERMQRTLDGIRKQSATLGKEMRAAMQDDFNNKKGPTAVLRKSKREQLKAKARDWRHAQEDKADLAKARAQDAAMFRQGNGIETADSKIKDTKSQITAVQQKLKDLKAKISPADIAAVEAPQRLSQR